jgi:hypothetical protein
MIRSGRRRFLAGMGGLLVALPFLEGLERPSLADTMDRRFFLNFRQWFGVQQRPRFGGKYKDELEGFWPDALIEPNGSVALTRELLEKTTNGELRATGELADFASSLLMVRGVRLMDLNGLHRPHLVQSMSGSRSQPTNPSFPNDPGNDNNAWPMHETLDTFIARSIDGTLPFSFETLVNNDGQTSYRNGENGAIPVQNPSLAHPRAAYEQLFGQAQLDAKAAALRLRASDAVLAELKSLRADARLSAEDRRRLDAHFDAMNEIETKLQCIPPEITHESMKAVLDSDEPKISDPSKMRWQSSGHFNEFVDTVADAFIQIAALGVACGAFRAANVVMCPDTNFNRSSIFDEGSSDYQQGFPGQYHALSHRAFTTGEVDNPDFSELEKGAIAHHRIDRWHARKFAKLLGLLRDAGTLDQGLTVWSNENASGNHWAYDMPYIVAGSAGGKLKTGRFVDLQSAAVEPGDSADDVAIMSAAMSKQMPCSKLLNTLGAALGLTSADKAPLHDFGGIQSNLPTITGNLPSLLT